MFNILHMSHSYGVERLSFKAAEWTTKYQNDLPDSSFAYIEPGGKKDSEGKTTPRGLRHFPYKDENGNVHMPHLNNGMAQITKSTLSKDVQQRIHSHLLSVYKKLGKEHTPCSVPGCKGYSPSEKSMLSDSEAFYSYLKRAQRAQRVIWGIICS